MATQYLSSGTVQSVLNEISVKDLRLPADHSRVVILLPQGVMSIQLSDIPGDDGNAIYIVNFPDALAGHLQSLKHAVRQETVPDADWPDEGPIPRPH